jgi:hypothetical protein
VLVHARSSTHFSFLHDVSERGGREARKPGSQGRLLGRHYGSGREQSRRNELVQDIQNTPEPCYSMSIRHCWFYQS